MLQEQVDQLILYRGILDQPFFRGMLAIDQALKEEKAPGQIKQLVHAWLLDLLKVSTQFGFDVNLWQSHLIYHFMMDENPFSLTCENKGFEDQEASVRHLVLEDFMVLKALLHMDLSYYDHQCQVEHFELISHYQAREKTPNLYQKQVGQLVEDMREACVKAESGHELFHIFANYYKNHGAGVLGMYRAFSYEEDHFVPVHNIRTQTLEDLVGYESQKDQLLKNTRALVMGKPSNNVLLYGDSGTGKSSSIKALIHAFWQEGLRIVEVKKVQLSKLETIMKAMKMRPYPFIIYMDDLSFEEFEVEYKYLKAVIEGGLAARPLNIAIYATSNRRHFIKEVWDDRKDMSAYEVHRSDTMQEKLSLVDRFGLTINYSKPDQKAFFEIVTSLAQKEGIDMESKQLITKARQWEMRYHGLSGRSARQFIDSLLSD